MKVTKALKSLAALVLLARLLPIVTHARQTLSGTAAVTGLVKFVGPRPAPTHINMNADPSCAKLHPGGVTSEELLAAADGGLQNVVVFVSEGLGDRTFDSPPQPVSMEQK
ncbi:MAG TPA: hypothetical protein VF749_10190, partial [Candidatus Acidoferrum sp.]